MLRFQPRSETEEGALEGIMYSSQMKFFVVCIQMCPSFSLLA